MMGNGAKSRDGKSEVDREKNIIIVGATVMPNSVIPSDKLAEAMVRLGLDENLYTGSPVLENRDIQKVVSQ